MSLRVMDDVWRESAQGGTGLLVLLKLADNAHEETRVAWPSVQHLAERCRVSRRTVQRVLRDLEAAGEIETVKAGNGRLATEYRVLVGRGVNLTPHDTHDAPGATPMTPQPSVEPSEKTKTTSGGGGSGAGDQASLTVPNERVERFLDAHAQRVVARLGEASRPSKTQGARNAARWILEHEPDSAQIVSRLDFALHHRFWSDKVLTLADFRKHWKKLTAQWLADKDFQSTRRPDRESRPDEPFPKYVSYENDRQEITR